jgi:hypothetical protein
MPGLSISEDYGPADKFSLSLLELAEDGEACSLAVGSGDPVS